MQLQHQYVLNFFSSYNLIHWTDFASFKSNTFYRKVGLKSDFRMKIGKVLKRTSIAITVQQGGYRNTVTMSICPTVLHETVNFVYVPF